MAERDIAIITHHLADNLEKKHAQNHGTAHSGDIIT
jgi:hypothetical protein